MVEQIREELFRLRDTAYGDFQSRLLPTVPPETIIGVRTPALRNYARRLAGQGDVSPFLRDLPHAYFDENQLHAFLISRERDFRRCLREVDRFLPYIDNWATCDQLSPGVFGRHRQELAGKAREWVLSGQTYTVRFGIGMLMRHFLDDGFSPEYPELVAEIRSEEYYVNMGIAWYFATALAKRYEQALPFLEDRRLAPWTHNKAIQKAAESFRVPPERKEYLKRLRVAAPYAPSGDRSR